MSAPSVSGMVARQLSPAARPTRSRLGAAPSPAGVVARLQGMEATAQRWLVAHSIAILRMSMGAIFLAFGVLKLFPGVSPAQGLVERTIDIRTFGLVPGAAALVIAAAAQATAPPRLNRRLTALPGAPSV